MKIYDTNKLRATRPYLWALALGTLLGCSTMQVTSEFENSTDFKRLKTFDFAKGNQIQPADAKVNVVEARQKVRGIIADALGAKGYRWQTNAPPDFVIGYRIVGLDKEEQRETDPISYAPSESKWAELTPSPYLVEFREGTLVLTIGDPATKKIVWRASGTAELSRSITPTQREKTIRESVAELLAKFPPH